MHQKSRVISDPAFILLLLQRVGTRFQDHAILLRCAPRNANSPDDFSVHQQWQAALDRNSTLQDQVANTLSTRRHHVLEYFGRALEQNCGARLANRHPDAARLSAVHFLEVDEAAPGVGDGDSHGPVVLARLGYGRGSDLLSGFQIDR